MLGMKATKLFLFCGSFQYPETLRNSIVESNITSWSLQRSRLDVGPFNFFLKLEHCNEIKAEPNAPHYFQKQPMMRTLISKTCMEIAPAWISVAILKVLRIWLCVLFILMHVWPNYRYNPTTIFSLQHLFHKLQKGDKCAVKTKGNFTC